MKNARSGKPGPKSVDPASRGSSPSGFPAGNPGKSMPSRAIPGPKNPGPPPAMKKALAKKKQPDRGTSFPGLVR